MAEEKNPNSTGITFGKILAGAGMAAGAVLLTVAVIPTGISVGDIVNGLSETVGLSTAEAPALSADSSLNTVFPSGSGNSTGFWTTMLNNKAAIGGALAVGSYMAKDKLDDIQQNRRDAIVQAAEDHAAEGRYAKMIEIKRMQGEMKAKMALATPELVQAEGPARG